ncbi:MAG: response regulator transcription factor [Verrucomicrobiales bacterium]|jgi:DNA-binding NarL/FixJ family response regulator|nr:response regulator transcription factor [bacterium]MDF2375786.1 response regulator transcription factor [Verrucomicrobiales bacterium]
MSETTKARVFIVDDHPIMRLGLSQLIKSIDGVEVAGEAGSATEALHLLDQSIGVDLAIVDVSLPDRSGLELIKDLRVLHERIKCLVISSHDEEVYAERVLRAGGRGYMMKDRAPDLLEAAVKQVLSGGIFLSSEMTARMMEVIAGGGSSVSVSSLSDRELEVYRAIGEGKSSREIAGLMGISIRTVDAHRTHIKEKLNLRDAAELTHSAIRWVESQS